MSLISFLDPFGTAPGSSLNWSQQALLKKAASGTQQRGPAIDTYRICRELEGIGQKVDDVVDAIEWLVEDLGLRLDTQTELLNQQLDLLADIARTLHSPARTRAAERLVDAAELLRHHRNERALLLAEQAIEDDPNNDTAFVVAAWAALGLEAHERARNYFREAAQATVAEQGAEARHMNAVRLAARLTFVLDGPECALRELDAADPFIDPDLSRKHTGLPAEKLRLIGLRPNIAGAVKFDRAVYHAAANSVDVALKMVRDIAEEHNIIFCEWALADPVLSKNETLLKAALESIESHKALKEEINELLPPGETRWRALLKELQQHRIEDARAIAVDRFGNFFTADPSRRKALNEKVPGPPNMRWLEDVSVTLKEFNRFSDEMRPLIEHERRREAALDAAVQNFLREHRKYRLVDRERIVAVVGQHAMIGGYDFKRITVDKDEKITIEDHAAAAPAYLISKFKAANRK